MWICSSPNVLRRAGTLLAVLSLLLPLVSCGKKRAPMPSSFLEVARAPTGDPDIEYRISETERFSNLGADQLATIEERIQQGVETPEDLNDFAGTYLVHGKGSLLIDKLFARSMRSPGDAGKLADTLGLAMGRLQWGRCAELARTALTRYEHAGTYLVRALCEYRNGNPEGAKDNFNAAHKTEPFDVDFLKRLMGYTARRGSSGALRPLGTEEVDALRAGVLQRGQLDRLMVSHLAARFDPPYGAETIEFGAFRDSDVRMIVASRNRDYRYCYALADEASGGERFEGRMEVEFTIAPDGALRDLKAVSSEWSTAAGKAKVEDCVFDQMSRLRFPMPRYGMPILVRHKLSYNPN